MSAKQTREPKQNRSIETRNRFIEAGIALFTEKGYYYTNAKEIARKAGAAVGSFYAYFKDKMDLFLAIIDHYNIIILSEINKAFSQLQPDLHDPKIIIKRIVETAVMSHTIYPGLHNEIDILGMKESEVRKKKSEVDNKSMELIGQIFKAFEKEMTHPDPDRALVLVYCLVEEGGHFILGDGDKNPDVYISEIADMIHKYLFK